MSDLERRLRGLGVFRTDKSKNFLVDANKRNKDFSSTGGIQDDHIPFLKRGVEILHIIPVPFPQVWHTSDDNGENLDMGTVHDWAILTTAFAAEWMELEGFFETKVKRGIDTTRTEL